MAADTYESLILKISMMLDDSGVKQGSRNIEAEMKKTGATVSKTWSNTSKNIDKSTTSMEKAITQAFGKMETNAKSAFKSMEDKLLGPLGISVGVSSLIKLGFSLNQTVLGWHNSFRSLSDATGDTTKAVSTMTTVWGQTGATLGTITGVMNTLGSHGLPVANKQFEEMAVWVTNVNNASGISADALAGITVGLNQMYGISLKTGRQMTSSMMALGDGFGYTNTQIEAMLKTTTSIIEKMGMFFDNVDKGSKDMVKGIGAGAAAMKTLGVSAQSAGNFFTNILDPEKINENMQLFARLGISYGETLDMMSAENGQGTFIDKLMQNLPKLSQQITALRNPMQRLQFAKSLGLPLEIAQKMAKGTQEQIAATMEEFKNKSKDEEQTKKKQEKAKADQGRFDEALMFLKMNAMMPIMNFVNKHMPLFFQVMGRISELFKKFAGTFADTATDFMKPIEALLRGDMSGFWKSMMDGVGNLITNAIGLFANNLPSILGDSLSFLFEGMKQLYSKSFWAGIGVTLFGALKMAKTAKDLWISAQTAKAFITGFPIKQSATSKVVDAAESAGGAGGVGGLMGGLKDKWSKAKGFMKGKGKYALIAGGLAAAGAVAYNAKGDEGPGDSGALRPGAPSTSDKLVSGASAIGGAATIGGMAAAKMAGKAIPGIGLAIAIIDGLYQIGHGIYKAGDELGKGMMDQAQEQELMTLQKKRANGEELTVEEQRQKEMFETKKLTTDRIKELQDQELLTGKLSDKEKEELDFKVKSTKTTAGDMVNGALGGAASFASFGLLDSAEMTRKIAGQGPKEDFGFGKADAENADAINKKLERAEKGEIELDKWEKRALELRSEKYEILRELYWNQEDSDALKNNKNKIKLLENLGRARTAVEEKEYQKHVKNITMLEEKKGKMAFDFNKTFSLGLAKIFSVFSDTGVNELGAGIASKFTNMWDGIQWIVARGIMAMKQTYHIGFQGLIEDAKEIIQSAMPDFVVPESWKKNTEKYKRDMANEGEIDRLMDKIGKYNKLSIGQDDQGGVHITSAVTEIEDAIRAMEGMEGRQGEVATLKDYLNHHKGAADKIKKSVEDAKKLDQAEKNEKDAKAAETKKSMDKIEQHTGAGAGAAKQIAENTKTKTTSDRQDYINFWLKNPGFAMKVGF